MSAYKKITTQFKTLESLRKAFADMGLTAMLEVSADGKANTLKAKGYGYGNVDRAAAVVLRTASNGGYEDVGFTWNGSAYEGFISTHDSGPDRVGRTGGNFGDTCLDRLSQRYGFHEVSRQARLKGYTVNESQEADGTITLTLGKISY